MSGFKSLYQPYLHMERMVSESATFQEIVGAADATEAKERIRFISCQDYDKNNKTYDAMPMPRVAIWNLGARKVRTSAACYATQPRMILSLEIEIPADVERNHDAEFRYCGPIYEAIEDEIAAGSATPTNLQFEEINYLQVPSPSDPKENQGKRIWGADIEFICRG